jgi:hypothetical protein
MLHSKATSLHEPEARCFGYSIYTLMEEVQVPCGCACLARMHKPV